MHVNRDSRPVPKLPILQTSEQELFQHWFRNARSGARIIYHRGYLARDQIDDLKLFRMAAFAYFCALKGDLILTQRKNSEFNYDYIAQKV